MFSTQPRQSPRKTTSKGVQFWRGSLQGRPWTKFPSAVVYLGVYLEQGCGRGERCWGGLWEEHRTLPWAETPPTQFPSMPVLGLWIPQTSDSGHPSGSGVESRTQAYGECSLLEASLTSLWRYVGWAGIRSRGSSCRGSGPSMKPPFSQPLHVFTAELLFPLLWLNCFILFYKSNICSW